MSEATTERGVSRSQFLRNTAKGFCDAAAGAGPAANLGGQGVLPPLPSTVTIAQAATVLTPYIPNVTAGLTAVGFPKA
jgi:hypothetical protein